MSVLQRAAELCFSKANSQEGTFKCLVLSLFVLVLIGVVDTLTGYELQFFLFYFVPVMMAAWWGKGRLPVATMCVVAVLVWIVSDRYTEHPYALPIYQYWNASIRFLAFLIVGMAIHAVRRLLLEERDLNDELRKINSEVRQLRGLLPICAGCKKIRNDQGYWEAIEVYIGARSDAEFSHGLCPECMERLYPEFSKKKPEEASPHSSDIA